MESGILKQDDYLRIIIKGIKDHSGELSSYFVETAKENLSSQSSYAHFLKELAKANKHLHNLLETKAYHAAPTKKPKPKDQYDAEMLEKERRMGWAMFSIYSPNDYDKYNYFKATIYDDHVFIDLIVDLKDLNYTIEELMQLGWYNYLTAKDIEFVVSQIEHAKEILEEDQPAAKIVPNNFNSGYETDSLKEIFLPSGIDKFIKIEKRLLEDGLINNDTKFNNKKGNKTKLIGLIFFLKERKYFKPRFAGKNVDIIYRRYFEERYKTDLAESIRKFSKGNHTDLDKYFSLFIPKV